MHCGNAGSCADRGVVLRVRRLQFESNEITCAPRNVCTNSSCQKTEVSAEFSMARITSAIPCNTANWQYCSTGQHRSTGDLLGWSTRATQPLPLAFFGHDTLAMLITTSSTRRANQEEKNNLCQLLQNGGGATPPRLLAKSRRGRSATTRLRQQACCRGSHTGGDDHPPCSAEEHVAQPCANKGAQRTVCQEESRRPAMAGPSGESRGEKPFLGVVPESSEKKRRRNEK